MPARRRSRCAPKFATPCSPTKPPVPRRLACKAIWSSCRPIWPMIFTAIARQIQSRALCSRSQRQAIRHCRAWPRISTCGLMYRFTASIVAASWSAKPPTFEMSGRMILLASFSVAPIASRRRCWTTAFRCVTSNATWAFPCLSPISKPFRPAHSPVRQSFPCVR